MVPTFPANVSVEVVPEQIDEVPEIVPATEVGDTLINPETLLVTAGPQVPVTIQ